MSECCPDLQAVQCVCFGEHLELSQLSDEPDGLVLGLNVDLVLLTDLKHTAAREDDKSVT